MSFGQEGDILDSRIANEPVQDSPLSTQREQREIVNDSPHTQVRIKSNYTGSDCNPVDSSGKMDWKPPAYQHDFDGGYMPDKDTFTIEQVSGKLARIKDYAKGVRYAVEQEGGVNHTNMVCTLNVVLELVEYLEMLEIDDPDKALHVLIECKDFIRRWDREHG